MASDHADLNWYATQYHTHFMYVFQGDHLAALLAAARGCLPTL
jgi:hypothetical protein